MELLLIRHPVPDIEKGVCYGRMDLPLRAGTEPDVAGIAQAVRQHRSAVVWSSPAKRCLVPARMAATEAQAQLRVDDRLQELNFGQWEGVRWADIDRSLLDRWADEPVGFAPPTGESGLSLLARVSDLLKTLTVEGLDCAVITHGGPLKILRALASGATPDLMISPPPFGAMIKINC